MSTYLVCNLKTFNLKLFMQIAMCIPIKKNNGRIQYELIVRFYRVFVSNGVFRDILSKPEP